jgi:hypothetical protein
MPDPARDHIFTLRIPPRTWEEDHYRTPAVSYQTQLCYLRSETESEDLVPCVVVDEAGCPLDWLTDGELAGWAGR